MIIGNLRAGMRPMNVCPVLRRTQSAAMRSLAVVVAGGAVVLRHRAAKDALWEEADERTCGYSMADDCGAGAAARRAKSEFTLLGIYSKFEHLLLPLR